MSPDETDGQGQEQSRIGLHHTTSANLQVTGRLIPSAGIPQGVSIHAGNLIFGGSTTSSQRSFVVIKNIGEGSFGSVFLCDWHGKLPYEVPPSTTHKVNGVAKPEWIGMRLVAVKKLKRRVEHGWDECQNLKELKALRALTPHPCVVPLYDSFLSSETSELYLVFEAMEGDLYRFMRARKGRPLAIGLLCCILKQIASGLHHIHSSGYFHRDLKPENILFTTSGLLQSQPDDGEQKDVAVICKIADFGSAREISSAPPYTKYVSARWYRAPEVLLRQRDYSTPVDMWALGTIMAELVNLKPIFPGSEELDQISRIIIILGDPTDHGVDEHGRSYGGGPWPLGVELAKRLGFAFTRTEPRDMHAIFNKKIPRELVNCISDLLKFDPSLRLTSQQCLAHECLRECPQENLSCVVPKPKLTLDKLSIEDDSHMINAMSELTVGMK